MSRTNDPMDQTSTTQNQEGGLRESAAQVGQNLRDMGSQVRDTAREHYDQLRDQATQYYEQGRERAREWEQNLETYVQDQPLKALLIAAGAGFLLGALWKRS